MIAFAPESSEFDRLSEAADFLRSCSATKPTQQNLRVVELMAVGLLDAMSTGDKSSLRGIIDASEARNAPTADLLAAAQHLVQMESFASSGSSVGSVLREIAEAAREAFDSSFSTSRLFVAAV